jgi:hypothetical protein
MIIRRNGGWRKQCGIWRSLFIEAFSLAAMSAREQVCSYVVLFSRELRNALIKAAGEAGDFPIEFQGKQLRGNLLGREV